MSSTPFEKGLRGNGGSSTPRTAKHNTRYMSGSKGPGELDDAVSSPDSASPAVSRTPSATVSRGAATSGRQGGTYSSPFREMVSCCWCARGVCRSAAAAAVSLRVAEVDDAMRTRSNLLPAVSTSLLTCLNNPDTICITPTAVLLIKNTLLQHGIGGASRATPRVKSTLATASKPPVPRQNSNVNDNDGDAVSITESDDVSVMTEDDYAPQEGDSVQVVHAVSWAAWQPDVLVLLVAVCHVPAGWGYDDVLGAHTSMLLLVLTMNI